MKFFFDFNKTIVSILWFDLIGLMFVLIIIVNKIFRFYAEKNAGSGV